MWGMIGLGDRAKDNRRGHTREVGSITQVNDQHVVIKYEDGSESTVPIADTVKAKR